MSILQQQHHVLRRGQLAATGIDRWRIRNELAARRWRVIGRAVVLHNGPLTRAQLLWVAVINHTSPAGLAGATALEWHGLRGFQEPEVHVLAPAGARMVTTLPGVRTHLARSVDVRPIRHLPCVRPALAVVQAASWQPSARRACGIAVSAVQQRRGLLAALAEELTGSRRRHAPLLRSVLSDAAGGADSLAEIDFMKLARAGGVRTPRQQAIRRDPSGRVRFLDADFETFTVEVDGGFHLRAPNYWADMERQNELVIGGDRVLRFPSYLVRSDPAVIIDQLRRASAAFLR